MKTPWGRYWRAPLEHLFALSRGHKSLLLLGYDLLVIPLAVWLAAWLRWGTLDFPFGPREWTAVAITVVCSAVVFLRSGLYRAVVRYMGQQAMLTVVRGVGISAVLLAVASFLTESRLPRSTPFIYAAVALLLIGGIRLLVRAVYQQAQRAQGAPLVIYGAGDSGRQLLQALYQTGAFSPLAFLDDNPALQGSIINGMPVYPPEALERLTGQQGVGEVLLAMPSVSRSRRREIIRWLENYPVRVQTVPSLTDLVAGRARVADIREVDIADLLGRDPVPPQPQLLKRCIKDRVVAVTGAGGSIGSELCRQIAAIGPRELVLLDVSEYALYDICRELEREHPERPLTALLGSVRDRERMERIFRDFSVETVYHTAAYKHVPMVEFNVVEGVLNNVFGTVATAQAARDAGVRTFVLISTDKAVRPTNVMGASKRLAELVLQQMAHESPESTLFAMVRFGNVLGSSGSVIPAFREQIRGGGPVTVTHKDVVRYFMTIREAAQLVIQAGSMAQGGEVFVLDMGEPVRIAELARTLVQLMGFSVRDEDNPDGDIEIVFTGLRPGEKLYEELLIGTNVSGTLHPRILRAEEDWLPGERLGECLARLWEACGRNDCETIHRELQSVVSGFAPDGAISDRLWHRRGPEDAISAEYPGASAE